MEGEYKIMSEIENCGHDCSSCSAECASRDPKSLLEKPHAQSTIRKVIGVVSGKGGVGKSMVSSMLAVNFQKKGFNIYFRIFPFTFFFPAAPCIRAHS